MGLEYVGIVYYIYIYIEVVWDLKQSRKVKVESQNLIFATRASGNDPQIGLSTLFSLGGLRPPNPPP